MGELLRAVAGELDALPGQWLVETISTPATVYRDLQGTRKRLDLDGQAGGVRPHHDDIAHEDFRPERVMLGSIGRLDLLAS
jgi:hypothetical protein